MRVSLSQEYDASGSTPWTKEALINPAEASAPAGPVAPFVQDINKRAVIRSAKA